MTDAVMRPPRATANTVSRRLSRRFSSLRPASGQRSSTVLACRNRLYETKVVPISASTVSREPGGRRGTNSRQSGCRGPER